MGLMDLVRRKPAAVVETRDASISLEEWAGMLSSFSFGGVNYTLGGARQEDLGSSFPSYVTGGYKSNGVVFACMGLRMSVFSEARFMFRNVRRGRPGDLFDYNGSDLGLLRRPWEGGTTGDLLSQMIQYADLAGNAYVVRRAGRLTPLRPDWVSIIGGVPGNEDASVWHPDARVLGYAYTEGGPGSGIDPVFYLADEIAHFAPIPDPQARFRGMSWLTPIVREVMADKAMSDHKISFLENGATPNLAVKLNVDDLEKFKSWISEFKKNHEGSVNAYKTMFLAAGADVSVVGADMQQLSFKETQGAGETRIAAAAGTPPVLVGLSEGLEAATYANYKSAARRFIDMTMRTLWRNAAASLSQIITVPSDSELWYDERDIKVLQDDELDAASIASTDASSVQTLVNSGFTPESVVKAIAARDMTLLVHTGLLSVQLQDPTAAPPEPTAPEAPSEVPAKREEDGLDLLERELMLMLRERDAEQPINVNVTTPDVKVDVHPAEVTVEPAHITVEPARIDAGAIQVNIEAPEPPDVNVTVERSGKRRVEFGDGRGATVTEGDVKKVVYDDGREVTITEVDE